MHSTSSCGGGYIQYDVEVRCPSCGRVADIKLSKSRDNPGRLFYKCNECGKFVKWANATEDRRRVLDEDASNNHAMGNELREIIMLLKDINGRILVGIVIMVAILLVIAMK